MSRNRYKLKGRRDSGTFTQFPHAVAMCPNYRALSHYARSLLMEFMLQFNGSNNGDLVATWSLLKERGWASKTTVTKRRDELIYYGFIVQVQQGGINVGGKKRPSLYALSWLQIDKIGYSDGFSGDSDWKVGDLSGAWKIHKPPLRQPRRKRKNPKELIAGRMNTTSCTHLAPSGVPEIVN